MQLDPVDHASQTPPFEQVRSQVAALIASGGLPAGTRLPTVRGLAGEVGLAVNTVARVYKELEADGLVATEGRRGTFVTSSHAGSDVRDAAAAYVLACRRRGLTRAEAVRLVESGWDA
ncbi:GntR family transcriptional regulator [Nocardioides currus]|uniref:GntR family transcriptional regulator n=1 Tax=Nocardioides currus TaxID=2133958 RepID=A0A2R7Z0M5_9ACTN|nr:GntR family transcriptional regulator [Nocardioides currus]PUA81709.1 GntR family transcriptional regulator [Nocardioides currus]